MMYGVSAMLMGAAFFMMYTQEQKSKKIKKSGKTWHTGKADIGGDWQLLDTQGQPFGSEQLKNSYYLLYFGFCNCPDICPNTMNKLAKAYTKAKKELPNVPIKMVFISVDPDRDNPARIDKWLSFFGGDFIGVTAKSNDDPALR